MSVDLAQSVFCSISEQGVVGLISGLTRLLLKNCNDHFDRIHFTLTAEYYFKSSCV